MTGYVYAAIAFVVLWVLLAGTGLLVLRASRRLQRGEEDGPREHGL